MRLVFTIAVSLTFHAPGYAVERVRDQEPFEEAIDNALGYLAHGQTSDGAWMARTIEDQAIKDPAVTALCVMAFQSAGHVPGEGPYGKVVENGIKFVLSQQQKNGIIAGRQQAQMEMYQHGIGTLMLAESIGMIPDRAIAKRLREQLALAVTVILKAQVRAGEHRGGWRYTTQSFDSDISVTAWQLMALRAAKNIGCDVPGEPIERAVAYIKRCHDPISGGYRYQHFGGVTVPCTGAGILSLELTGHHGSPEARKAGTLLRNTPLDARQAHFFYGVYYTSQAMFQLGDDFLGDDFWTTYRKDLHHLLLRDNPPKAAGYWIGIGRDDARIGLNYCTAMAILALSVEYRFLPIYQRNEEPAGGPDSKVSP